MLSTVNGGVGHRCRRIGLTSEVDKKKSIKYSQMSKLASGLNM